MINTQNWKEFKISDLFYCKLSKGDLKESECDEGTINLISSGTLNNGVVKRIDETGDGKAEIFNENCLTLDMFCNCFYQDEKFYSVSHGRVNILIPKFNLNQQIGLFIATILNKEQYRFSYGRAVYNSFAENLIIKLPVNDKGEPDWQYMTDFINEIQMRERESGSNLNDSLRTNNLNPLSLNKNKWNDYRLGDLVDEIYKGKAYVKSELEESNDKGIVFVSRTDNDNGCDGFVEGNIEDYAYEKGNALIIGDTTSTCFYQEEDFICGDHIVVIRANWLNKFTGLYIKTLLEKERFKYNYGRSFKMELIKNTILKLPSDLKGNPDWIEVENYIKSIPYADRI